MGYLVSIIRPACLGALAGLGLDGTLATRWACFAGLALFYLMLVVRDGGARPGGGIGRD